jgi:tRNA (guanine10-N2)-dimethyltransferase
VAKLFFFLSGEHEDLPVSELKAILEAEGFKYEVLEKLDQVLRIEADPACVEAIRRRSAFTRFCGLELLKSENKETSIVESMQSENMRGVLKDTETFAARIRRVRTYASELNSMDLERRIGELLLEQNPNAKVNLRSPAKTFFGVLTGENFVFGLKLAEIPAKPFVERRARKKPFFHPSAMPSKLARCMVNLTRVRAEDLVFDPFCGTGSILIEAGIIHCRVLGSDVQRRMINGAIQNLNYFRIESDGMIISDASNPPLSNVDCVVTDPPYGRSTITLKRATSQIVEEVLDAATRLLGKGQRVCIASPKTLNIAQIGTSLGYKHLESHFVYVHRTLTREIALFEKT